jgi:hypothetical protein
MAALAPARCARRIPRQGACIWEPMHCRHGQVNSHRLQQPAPGAHRTPSSPPGKTMPAHSPLTWPTAPRTQTCQRSPIRQTQITSVCLNSASHSLPPPRCPSSVCLLPLSMSAPATPLHVCLSVSRSWLCASCLPASWLRRPLCAARLTHNTVPPAVTGMVQSPAMGGQPPGSWGEAAVQAADAWPRPASNHHEQASPRTASESSHGNSQ